MTWRKLFLGVSASPYARPSHVRSLSECHFYHTMELPGFGIVEGDWDLRHNIDAFLGNQDFTGKRVLEIGPASGFVSFEMERRGARVVSLEISDDPGWDFVPHPAAVLDPIREPRREIMRRLKNSYWLAHRALGSRAQLVYGDAYRIPESLGEFDIAIVANVLLHTRSPLAIVEQCARRAASIIVVDRLHPDLTGSPICRLIPSAENRNWDAWWQLSPELFTQFFGVLGFPRIEQKTSTHRFRANEEDIELYTLIAHRG